MAKVKADERGYYIRCDGYICRPEPVGATSVAVGDSVKVTHLFGSQTVNVEVGDGETWKTDIMYWWHAKEGRGDHAKKLRESDRERHWNLYGHRDHPED